ncbi:proline dehydrogenase 1, mitochondrial-like isoform X1 [Montipora foliosa]|uniref:proline dehydrogenase 1, mitochondrial-like isoform X1 n=2 Tax=Montipora foliosa TaxID=591990 RepID=UPI0035F1A115
MARKLVYNKTLQFKFLCNGDQANWARHFLATRASSSHTLAEVSRPESMLPVGTDHSLAGSESTRSTSLPGFTFDDTKNAYRSKTSWEIVRALAVFRLCSFDLLVNKNKELLNIGQKVLGKHLFRRLMKATFYGHFVAGEDQEAIKPGIKCLEKFGVGAILDYSVEEDLSESETNGHMAKNSDESSDPSDVYDRYKPHVEFADRRKGVYGARTYFYEGEAECDKRMETFLKCIDAAGAASSDGFAAIKVTALGRPQILMRISEILNQTQYFFDSLASDSVKMNKIGNIVARDKFLEGLERLGVEMSPEEANRIFHLIDTNKSGHIDVIEWHEFLTPQLKLSQLFKAKPQGDEKTGKPLISVLKDEELYQMKNMSERLSTLAQHAVKRGVRLMVDAEQSYFQPAIRHLTLDLMRQFNKDVPLVLNTYQCYLKDTYCKIQTDMELARREGYMFGAKLVRGAYMEQERLRAKTLGYEDPIHQSYKATSRCFDEVTNAVLEETKRGNANVLVATHNENSIVVAVKRMHELGISPEEKRVFFGQLLGMSDPISFTLGKEGYAVYKYVPFGPVEDVLPYLSRRAVENKGLLKGVLKERRLLWNELKRRCREGELNYDPARA